MKVFHLRMWHCRKLLGWSQHRLSLESGINQSRISRIERGEREPDIYEAQQISAALKVPVFDLMDPEKDFDPQVVIETKGGAV